MEKEKIWTRLQKVHEKIEKVSREKDEQIELIRKFNKKYSGKKCEEETRKLQYKLDIILSNLSKEELNAISLLEKLEVDPLTRKKIVEDRLHVKERAEKTEERMDKHRHRSPIPWAAYEESLKDTKEKENLERRIKELREKEVFTHG